MPIGSTGSLPALAAQPESLSATEAVVGAFHELGLGFVEIEGQVRELAMLTRSSETLDAWTLHIYVRYELAIAELIAPRMSQLAPPRSQTSSDRGAGNGHDTNRAGRLA